LLKYLKEYYPTGTLSNLTLLPFLAPVIEVFSDSRINFSVPP